MTEHIRKTWRRLTPFGRLLAFLVVAALAIGLPAWVARAVDGDADGDGMSDAYELLFGLNSGNPADAALDPDRDALDNAAEASLWTDPWQVDTDRDGFWDRVDSNAVSRAYLGWGDPLYTTGDSLDYTWPAWMVGAYRTAGEWQAQVPSWHVPASVTAGVGRLNIEVDRTRLTHDAVLKLGYFDHAGSSLYVDLFDASEAVTASDLFGNILHGGNARSTGLFNIPLSIHPSAVGIRLRRGAGEVTVYDSLLYMDADGDGLDADQEAQLGTSDSVADSDSDGINDGAEVLFFGTDPMSPFSAPGRRLAIGAGEDFSLFAPPSGQAWAWGMGGQSQLGIGSSPSWTSMPTRVRAPGGIGYLAGVQAVDGGWNFGVALKADGTVWTWGANGNGRLGDDTTTERITPVPVHGVGNVGVLSGVAGIAAGEAHGLALLADRTVVAWGDNGSGQLGDNTTTSRHTPVRVLGSGGSGLLTNVVAVAAGRNFSYALAADGAVWAWGANAQNQLGDGATTMRKTPVQVHGPDDVGYLGGIVAIAAGPTHGLAAAGNGSVWGWGDNGDGKLGDNTTATRSAPVQAHGENNAGFLSNVVAVSAGQFHSVALDRNGAVWAWGQNNFGRLGDNTDTTRKTPVRVHGPGNVGFFTNIVAVVAGQRHTLALDQDGVVWSWGCNQYGSIGDGTTTHRFTPVPVDSDADGLPDAWELAHFGNLDQAPGGDPDGDGLSNLQEYQQGTDPNSAPTTTTTSTTTTTTTSTTTTAAPTTTTTTVATTTTTTTTAAPAGGTLIRLDFGPNGTPARDDGTEAMAIAADATAFGSLGENKWDCRTVPRHGTFDVYTFAGLKETSTGGVTSVAITWGDADHKISSYSTGWGVPADGAAADENLFSDYLLIGAGGATPVPYTITGLQPNTLTKLLFYGVHQRNFTITAGGDMGAWFSENNIHTHGNSFVAGVVLLTATTDASGSITGCSWVSESSGGESDLAGMQIYQPAGIGGSTTTTTAAPTTSTTTSTTTTAAPTTTTTTVATTTTTTTTAAGASAGDSLIRLDLGGNGVPADGFVEYKASSTLAVRHADDSDRDGASYGTTESQDEGSLVFGASGGLDRWDGRDIASGNSATWSGLLDTRTGAATAIALTVSNANRSNAGQASGGDWRSTCVGLNQISGGGIQAASSAGMSWVITGLAPNTAVKLWIYANDQNYAGTAYTVNGVSLVDPPRYGGNWTFRDQGDQRNGYGWPMSVVTDGSGTLTGWAKQSSEIRGLQIYQPAPTGGGSTTTTTTLADTTTSTTVSDTTTTTTVATTTSTTTTTAGAAPAAGGTLFRVNIGVGYPWNNGNTGDTPISSGVDSVASAASANFGASGSNLWNNIAGGGGAWPNSTTPVALLETSGGAAPGVAFHFDPYFAAGGYYWGGGGDATLYGKIAQNVWEWEDSAPRTYSITGLQPDTPVELFWYSNHESGNDRNAATTISATGAAAGSTAVGGVAHVLRQVATADGAGTVSGTWTAGATVNGGTFGAISGVQIYQPDARLQVKNGTVVGAGPTAVAVGGYLAGTGGATSSVWLCWGTSDCGTGAWPNVEALGIRSRGALSKDVSGLSYTNTTYYFRYFASNSVETAWAAPTATFGGTGDTDSDGMQNGWELLYGLNPLVNDASQDADGDGLTNLQEYQEGTHPNDSDSDHDGVSDYEEHFEAYTDPLVAEFDGTVTDVSVVDGADAVAEIGNWVTNNTSLISMGRRGYAEYAVNSPTADMYCIKVDATHLWLRNSCGPLTPVDASDLLIYVDGRYIGKKRLVAPEGVDGSVRAFTPWLEPGAHTIRIYWDNVHRRLALKLQRIHLQSLGGPDSDSDGVKDWVEVSVAAMTSLDRVHSAAYVGGSASSAAWGPGWTNGSSTSVVSPVCIEGVDRYPDLMSIGVNGQTNLAARAGAGERWYADVPLSSTGSTAIAVSYQSGAITREATVTWAPLNVLAAGNVRLRKGDALMLTASPAGATNGTVTLDVGTSHYVTTASEPVIHVFPAEGVYNVTGAYEAGEAKTIAVTVLGAAFPAESPACMLGRARPWDCPDVPPEAAVEADETVALTRNGQTLGITMSKVNRDHHLVARLGQDGPVLVAAKLNGFWIQAAVDSYLWVVEQNEDSAVWQQEVVAKAVPADVDIELSIFVAGVTFDDMTIERWITSADLNELGEYDFLMIRPNSVEIPTCHTIIAYQNGVCLGEAYYGGVLFPNE